MLQPLNPCSGSSPGSKAVTCRRAGAIVPDQAVSEPTQSHLRITPDGSRQPLSAAPVLVVFADHAGCPWLRPLRRGFRHCFVVIRMHSVWLACEPLKDRIELDALAVPDAFDLPAFLLPARPSRPARRTRADESASAHCSRAPDLRDRGQTIARDRCALGMDSLAAVRAPVRPETRLPGVAQGHAKRRYGQPRPEWRRLTVEWSRYMLLASNRRLLLGSTARAAVSSPNRLRRTVHG